LVGAIALSALLQFAIVTIPFLQPVFKVTPIPFRSEWGAIALLALSPVTVLELFKLLRARIRSIRAPASE